MNYKFQTEYNQYSLGPQLSTSIIRALISINAALFLIRYLMVGQFDMLNLGLSSDPRLGNLLPICLFTVIFFTYL